MSAGGSVGAAAAPRRLRARIALSTAPFLAAGALGGCGEVLLPPDPSTGPEAVAQALWEEVDAYYPEFSQKGVDWRKVGDTYLSRVGPDTPDRELWTILGEMLATLRDGHLALESPFGWAAYDGWYRGYPANYDAAVVRSYLGQPTASAAGGAVIWGALEPGIGYLYLGSFGRDGIGEAVDLALSRLGALDGLVVDVRDNGGGSDIQSEAAAGRFFTAEAVYRMVRYKTGPGHEDFGPEVATRVGPAGAQRFTGPVVVLQNRKVYSAAEDFVLAMRVRAGVTFVGDTTGGGSGNPIGRDLPNGWVAHVPRWRLRAADGTFFDGVGLGPDEVVSSTAAGQGRDAILERAIALLRRRSPSSP